MRGEFVWSPRRPRGEEKGRSNCKTALLASPCSTSINGEQCGLAILYSIGAPQAVAHGARRRGEIANAD